MVKRCSRICTISYRRQSSFTTSCLRSRLHSRVGDHRLPSVHPLLDIKSRRAPVTMLGIVIVSNGLLPYRQAIRQNRPASNSPNPHRCPTLLPHPHQPKTNTLSMELNSSNPRNDSNLASTISMRILISHWPRPRSSSRHSYLQSHLTYISTRTTIPLQHPLHRCKLHRPPLPFLHPHPRLRNTLHRLFSPQQS